MRMGFFSFSVLHLIRSADVLRWVFVDDEVTVHAGFGLVFRMVHLLVGRLNAAVLGHGLLLGMLLIGVLFRGDPLLVGYEGLLLQVVLELEGQGVRAGVPGGQDALDVVLSGRLQLVLVAGEFHHLVALLGRAPLEAAFPLGHGIVVRGPLLALLHHLVLQSHQFGIVFGVLFLLLEIVLLLFRFGLLRILFGLYVIVLARLLFSLSKLLAPPSHLLTFILFLFTLLCIQCIILHTQFFYFF